MGDVSLHGADFAELSVCLFEFPIELGAAAAAWPRLDNGESLYCNSCKHQASKQLHW